MSFNWIRALTVLGWLMSGIALAVVAMIILVYVFQGYLIYMPSFPPGSRQDVWRPDRFGMPYSLVTITAPDGIKTSAYYIPARAAEEENDGGRTVYAIFFCHANAGNLGHRLPIIRRAREMVGSCAVFMPSYRGYGPSEGAPSEAGIRMDTQCGLDWFVDKLQSTYKPDSRIRLIAYGQSLGGAVAIDLVSRNRQRFSGLIVENTFLSIPDLVPHLMPYLKCFTWLCREKWPSKDRICSLGGIKMLILSGKNDTLIPPIHSKILADLAKKNDASVRLLELDGGGHNDTVLRPGYFEAIREFVADL